MSRTHFRAALLVETSMLALLLAGPALAQQATAAPSAPTAGVSEVVVTATRQTSTVNRVSLSVAAVTQQALDQTGIKQTSDITRLVPGLNFAGSGGPAANVGNFSIRGIVGGTGAATTGVYLDDTALTKRANNGVQQNNGAPLPILFDLERVEVLKGPQGTLFGGSSQGGTVRFITPEPSLVKYSGMARVEVNQVNMGETGYEFGAAAGGPIVQDKLGFRLSGTVRRTPGWIEAVNPYSNTTYANNVNRIDDGAVHGALKWQATDRLSLLFSTYWTQTREASQVTSPTVLFSPQGDGQRAAPGATFTTPQVCINTQTRTASQPILAYDPSLPINGAPSGTPVQPATCTASTPAANRYIRPSFTYGPFRTGRNIYLMTNNQTLQPASTRTDVHSITANYDFGGVNAKFISSYLRDVTHNEQSQGSEDPFQRQQLLGLPATGTGALPTGFPLFALDPDYSGHFVAMNKRIGYQEELRLSSNTPGSRLSWVAGVYYSHSDVHTQYIIPDRNMERMEQTFWGVSVAQRLGIYQLPSLGVNGVGLYESILDAHFTDKELAGFFEGNLYLTSKLKLTGGVRVSQVSLDYTQVSYGVNGSRYPNSAGAYVSGSTTDTPVTPKVGLTYEFTPADLVYFTAAKGFRAGGVNSPVSPALCSTGLAQFGISFNQVPTDFKPDEVTSYELGGKFRLLQSKLQLNGALYRIDWTNIQSTFTIPGCGQTFVQNGGTARSQGVDLQIQYRPIPALNLAANVGYDDAKYLQAVVGPAGPVVGVRPSINAGDHFAVPNWQLSTSAQYDFNVMGRSLYVRGDYQWQSGYTGPGTFGVSVYNPYTLNVAARGNLNARLGVRLDSVDVNVYVNNLMDARDYIGNSGNGIGGCPATSPTCAGFTTYNPFVNQAVVMPRTIGLQANYRF